MKFSFKSKLEKKQNPFFPSFPSFYVLFVIFIYLFIYLSIYLFIYLFIYFLTDSKGKTFKVEGQKILVSLITDEPVTAIMVLFWW